MNTVPPTFVWHSWALPRKYQVLLTKPLPYLSCPSACPERCCPCDTLIACLPPSSSPACCFSSTLDLSKDVLLKFFPGSCRVCVVVCLWTCDVLSCVVLSPLVFFCLVLCCDVFLCVVLCYVVRVSVGVMVIGVKVVRKTTKKYTVSLLHSVTSFLVSYRDF